MADVVVTVPKNLWSEWLAEGDLAGDPWSGEEYFFWVPNRPNVKPGERVYVVAHGHVRGYSPLVDIRQERGSWALVRRGDAVAVTVSDVRPRPTALIGADFQHGHLHVPGFRGIRYRWWERFAEASFPGWRTHGVGP